MLTRPLSTWPALIAALAVCAHARGQSTHWSFKPPVRPAIPAIRNPQSAIRNPIDAFVLATLRTAGLSPSPTADRRTLIRRLTFDLTGLPPTPEETAAFVADRSPDAYAKVVDRLLASPHFGERWAQHWLDVVRFAESNGYEHDLDRPQAWRYREWVVNALNADMPYDRFLQLQVAGDLLQADSFEARVATGFLRCGPFHITGGNLDPKEMRQEWLTEAVNGIGNGVLGLTIGCARCHDHKFDPIPQKDYYRLQACFAATANNDTVLASDAEKKRIEEAVKAIKEKQKPIEAENAEIEKPYRERIRAEKIAKLAPEYRAALAAPAEKRTADQKRVVSETGVLLNISWDEVVNALSPADREKRAALRKQLFALDDQAPAPLPQAEGVGEVLPAAAMHLLVRGDVHNPGPEVTAGFPSVLSDHPPNGEGRLALARWLTSPDNPLTARVMVNRIWQRLFGRGLVGTPNDFGKNGQRPTHPELLDWLACEFQRQSAVASRQSAVGPLADPAPRGLYGAWSIKRMIRLIVLSDTYRQTSDVREIRNPKSETRNQEIDPDNHLLWRQNRKRLDAEALRDSVLAAAGTLNLQMGGPSVRVPLEPEVYDTIFSEYEPDNLWPADKDPKQHTRRSLYLFRKRNVRLPMMALFDQPDFMTACAARSQTVHALQALNLVNSEFMRKQGAELARRLFREEPGNVGARIDRLFQLAVGHAPSPAEMRATQQFLKDQERIVGIRNTGFQPVSGLRLEAGATKGSGLRLEAGVTSDMRAWSDLCLATLNLNEFIYER